MLLPYVDRSPATEARHRKVAVTLFAALFVIAVGLTVVGALFRGKGWSLVLPWDHLYLEL